MKSLTACHQHFICSIANTVAGRDVDVMGFATDDVSGYRLLLCTSQLKLVVRAYNHYRLDVIQYRPQQRYRLGLLEVLLVLPLLAAVVTVTTGYPILSYIKHR